MAQFSKDARVVFIGDSITAGTNYTGRIAAYYQANLPELRVKFKNAGVSGGSCGSAMLFYDASVASFAPTHATVMLGVNDSNRNALNLPDEAERTAKLDAAFDNYCRRMDELLDRLKADGVEVTLCTPAPYAEFFVTNQEPLPGGHALILRYAEHVRKTAAARGLALADFHMRLSELYLDEVLYNPDHVHPNDLGHYRMAECFLRSQGLEIGEYRTLAEVMEAQPLVGEWNTLAGKVTSLYAVEWMVVKNFPLPLDEKLKLVQGCLDDGRYENVPYFKSICEKYMENKPSEEAYLARMEQIWNEVY